MSVFATLGVILAILAGLINFGVGLMRRKHPLIALMRFGLSAFSVVAAATILIVKADKFSLIALAGSEQIKYFYLFAALAIFMGLTLMLPASVERNNLPLDERIIPTPAPKGAPSAATSDGGVRTAKPNDEWVN